MRRSTIHRNHSPHGSICLLFHKDGNTALNHVPRYIKNPSVCTSEFKTETTRFELLQFNNLLYSSGGAFDDETLSYLDELAEIVKNSLDLCMARAHQHDLSFKKNEILPVIEQAQNDLVLVLDIFGGLSQRNSMMMGKCGVRETTHLRECPVQVEFREIRWS